MRAFRCRRQTAGGGLIELRKFWATERKGVASCSARTKVCVSGNVWQSASLVYDGIG